MPRRRQVDPVQSVWVQASERVLREAHEGAQHWRHRLAIVAQQQLALGIAATADELDV